MTTIQILSIAFAVATNLFLCFIGYQIGKLNTKIKTLKKTRELLDTTTTAEEVMLLRAIINSL